MAIGEAQLDTWAKLGSVTQSASTYASVKGVLEDPSSPYYAESFETFLQGSYGNGTNIFADSDVDIVMLLNSTYYANLDNLSDTERADYNANRSPASYSHADFKQDVLGWLAKKFTNVVPGKKAIAIPAGGARRDSDVVVAAQFRRYLTYSSPSNQSHHKGICFLLPDGALIENFPKQHRENCTTKHQATNQWFKPTVRIFKNLRNRLLDDDMLDEGVAPSYFLEGLLYNVPNDKFGSSYKDTFINCFNWIANSDKSKLVTASGLHWLVTDGRPTSWPTANCDAFIDAARELWEQW